MALGNVRLLEELGIEAGKLVEQADSLRQEGQTVMLVAVDGKAAGLVAVADPVKETTPAAIQAASRRRHPGRHAYRRQPHHRRGGGPEAGH